MCGYWEEAQRRADELSKATSPQLRARAKAVLGILLSLAPDIDAAEQSLNEARTLLRHSGEIERACETGIRQLAAVLDLSPGASVELLASELQWEVSRIGNRRLLCMFHVTATNLHAAAGRLDLAKTHSVLAHSHLKAEPNRWLEASLALAESGISFLHGDLRTAIRLGSDASKAAEVSGHIWCRAAAATTCAFLSIRLGQTEQASRWIHAADRLTASIPVLRIANLDNVAQLALLAHNLGAARHTLGLMEDPEAVRGLRDSWYTLPTAHTRIRLNRLLDRWNEVDRLASEALHIAETRSDPESTALFAASRAEALVALKRGEEAVQAIGVSLRELPRATTATLSEVDRVLGVLLQHCGLPSGARRCLKRSVEIADFISDAVLADEAKNTEARFAESGDGGLDDVMDRAVQLWQLATAPKQPDALLRSVLGAAEFRPLVKGLELTSGVVNQNQSGQLDRHAVILRYADSREDNPKVLVLTSHPNEVSRLGALILVAAAESISGRSRRTRAVRSAQNATGSFDVASDVVVAPSMLELLDTATRIASTPITVLITGETGSGKEVFARFVHNASDRKGGPFVAVNCSALPRELLESTLFGHKRGAFTGASESFDGLVKGAEGGTLFLDEVGDLPLDLQPKFLRFLETGEVLPLGTNQPAKVNVRVLAATNANLSDLVAGGRFRADLFYRLNGIHFQLPPLRSRRTEIPALATHLLERYAEEFGKGDLNLAPEAMERLLIYDWPGNVRELASELRRVAALAEANSAIEARLLSANILAGPRREVVPAEGEPTLTIRIDQDLEQALETVERTMIARALERSRGRVDDAARLLGISRKGLFLKRRRYGLPLRES